MKRPDKIIENKIKHEILKKKKILEVLSYLGFYAGIYSM